jgi:hypothetical protein
MLDGLRKAEPLYLADKLEHVAPYTTAKTLKDLL